MAAPQCLQREAWPLQTLEAGIFLENKFRGGQIESFKTRGVQNLSQVEFNRAVNQVHLSTDMIIFI